MRVIDRIINELRQRRCSQVELAKHLEKHGVTKQTITDWKNDKSNTYYQYMADISIFLNVSTDYLLGLTDNPTPHKQEPVQQDQLSKEIANLTPKKRTQAENFIKFLKAEEEFAQELTDGSILNYMKPQQEL